MIPVQQAMAFSEAVDIVNREMLERIAKTLAAEVRRLRDEANGLAGSLDRAESVLQNLMSYLSVNGCRTGIAPENAELRIRDGIDMLVRPVLERAERAEAELKELREQEPVAYLDYWKSDGTGIIRKQQSNGLKLYTRPIPAPAPAVPEEWRNIVTEMVGWWDDQHMTLTQGKAIREKARALLQSTQTSAGGVPSQTQEEAHD